MNQKDIIVLTRDVNAVIVPVGDSVVLRKGEEAHITQSLGGTYTVIVNGNMFRVAETNADALGFQPTKAAPASTGEPRTREVLEKEVWNLLRTCYDPEIPVNIVDLGLIYDLHAEYHPAGQSISHSD